MGCWWWWFDQLVVWIFQHKRKPMGCWWWRFDVLVVWIFQHRRKLMGCCLLVVLVWCAGGVDFPTQTQVDELLVVVV